MSDFLKDIIKETGNEYAGLVSDGIDSADVTSSSLLLSNASLYSRLSKDFRIVIIKSYANG